LLTQFGPTGQQFSQPVTIYIPHAAETEHGDILEVRYFDAATEQWVSDGISDVQHHDGTPNHLLSFQITHFTIFAVTPTIDSEDINMTGSVDAVDVQLVINAVLGINIDERDADVNNDGAIDALDVQRVINAALGLDISE